MNDPFKELIIDALCGAGFNSFEQSAKYERSGYASFTGNQHNPRWEWNRPALAQVSVDGLQQMYQAIKERQALTSQARDVIAKAAQSAAANDVTPKSEV